MDALTHALMGAQAAYLGAGAGKQLGMRDRLLLGGLAAAFPDADFLAFLIDPLRFLADWHQAPTHSLVLLPCWALLLGAMFCVLTRRRQALGEAAVVSGVGLSTHLVLDLITAYGTQILYPLSDWRPNLGFTFVVDPLITLVLGASLAAALRTGRRGFAAAGLALLCLGVGAQALLKQQALRLGADAASVAGMAPDQLEALPQPFSPFNWKLIAQQGPRYQVAHVNLLGHGALVPPWPGLGRLHELAQAYVPPDRLAWSPHHRFGEDPQLRELAQQLWMRPDFAAFGRFAVFPALARVDASEAQLCVWFTDLRYDLPRWPETFRYGFCQEPMGGPWRLYRLRYFSQDARQRLG
ncbi:metal-dependent hydrolase [Ramlibacter sp. 2FC]|uniref:metal-dependent hydrolase n=1 Tax=Ramlibacter sp. 2FC TaxID=2502188 RepID=UPI0010F6683E|nr:metal-dependent hydrolase [Ramlibacter sp. 2FC]